jgi:hypothetical protein
MFNGGILKTLVEKPDPVIFHLSRVSHKDTKG